MGNYVIAKYIRLSIEDAKTDSYSIESQRLLLDAHIAGMGIPDAEILEFVDNGHSGTNFERPAVQELLELVRQGKINCIAVKDVSRFGRNMIETGYYIERVFPLFRVRFIAVSDNHDSAEHEGDTGGTELAFKFLIHEQYSRDLSMKIKTAKRARALRGELIPKNCAFGYKKVGKRLEINEPAAETVRVIFSMAAEGQKLTKIAERLYEENHPTPAEYRKAVGAAPVGGFSCIWNKSAILGILHDEQYTGTYIAGTHKRLTVGSIKTVKLNESEWIKIPDHHPAIISKEVFEAVRENISKRIEPHRKRELGTAERYRAIASPLIGKVICGCCGHVMKLSATRNAAFHCDFTRAALDKECYRLKISAVVLEAVVFERVREYAETILQSVEGAISQSRAKSGTDERIAQIEAAKRALYEKFILGAITTEIYRAEKSVLDAEFEREQTVQAAIEKKSASKSLNDSLRRAATDALETEVLSKPVTDVLIRKVLVYPGNLIEVEWNLPIGETKTMEIKSYA